MQRDPRIRPQFPAEEPHTDSTAPGGAGAAGTAGVKKAVELGLIPAGSTVVSIVTGNGLKDVQSGIQAAGEPMRVSPDMDALLAAFAAQDIRP